VTSVVAYASGLFCVALLAGFTGWRRKEVRWQIWRVGFVLAANWFLGFVFVTQTGNYTPWIFSLLIDALAAFAIMYRPAGKIQGLIGLTYFFQIAGHIAYGGRGLIGLETDPLYYYDALTFVAWVQLLAVGAWGAGIWGKCALHSLGYLGHALDRRKGARNDGGQT